MLEYDEKTCSYYEITRQDIKKEYKINRFFERLCIYLMKQNNMKEIKLEKSFFIDDDKEVLMEQTHNPDESITFKILEIKEKE